MRKRILLAGLYLVCGFWAYGKTLGSFTRKFPWRDNYGVSVLMGLAGPLGCAAPLLFADHDDWRLVPLTLDERWDAYRNRFPGLTREDFDRYR